MPAAAAAQIAQRVGHHQLRDDARVTPTAEDAAATRAPSACTQLRDGRHAGEDRAARSRRRRRSPTSRRSCAPRESSPPPRPTAPPTGCRPAATARAERARRRVAEMTRPTPEVVSASAPSVPSADAARRGTAGPQRGEHRRRVVEQRRHADRQVLDARGSSRAPPRRRTRRAEQPAPVVGAQAHARRRARAQATSPTEKRMNAISGPGRRDAAPLASDRHDAEEQRGGRQVRAPSPTRAEVTRRIHAVMRTGRTMLRAARLPLAAAGAHARRRAASLSTAAS